MIQVNHTLHLPQLQQIRGDKIGRDRRDHEKHDEYYCTTLHLQLRPRWTQVPLLFAYMHCLLKQFQIWIISLMYLCLSFSCLLGAGTPVFFHGSGSFFDSLFVRWYFVSKTVSPLFSYSLLGSVNFCRNGSKIDIEIVIFTFCFVSTLRIIGFHHGGRQWEKSTVWIRW
jgi:hypothetical protein